MPRRPVSASRRSGRTRPSTPKLGGSASATRAQTAASRARAAVEARIAEIDARAHKERAGAAHARTVARLGSRSPPHAIIAHPELASARDAEARIRLPTPAALDDMERELLRRIRREMDRRGFSERGAAREVFGQIDSGGSGFLSRGELASALRRIGLRRGLQAAEWDVLVQRFDTDGSGRISYADFARRLGVDGGSGGLSVTGSSFGTGVSSVAAVRRVFRGVDTNGTGQLSASELESAVRSMGFSPGPGDMMVLLRRFDEDGSSTLFRLGALQCDPACAAPSDYVLREPGRGSVAPSATLAWIERAAVERLFGEVFGPSALQRALDSRDGSREAGTVEEDWALAARPAFDFGQFARWAMPLSPRLAEVRERLKRAIRRQAMRGGGLFDPKLVFARLDADGSGSIDAAELRSALGPDVLAQLSPTDLGTLIQSMDSNGDGQIELRELVQLLFEAGED
ncbi:hypothetical protein FNF28_00018 [Cafeteria roenbergensis]|uniref:EF-hand domain-containing protein n=1 Tax=Cafeteria roenbergensis TaxID=33653 RepID=A0A5A8E5M1_CAFRO|nr:hypothetical protein FNF28_00018 [Cafeteria roenbergensis]